MKSKAFVLMLTLIISSVTIFVTNVNAQGPVAHWNFDEGSGPVAADSSGNGNTGTLMNGPQWVPGVSGTALSFDGINDYVRIQHSSSLDIVGNEISVEYWIKLSSDWYPQPGMPDSYSQILYDKGDAYTAAMIIGSGALRFNIPYVPPYPETTKNTWDANTWYHIANVFDGSQIRIFVNGVLDKAETVIGSVSRSSLNLAIGSHCFGGKNFFNGVIDEFAIYDYARTAEEIWNDWSAYAPESSPVAYWAFDEGSGSTAYDSSGNGNVGTLVGPQWVEGVSGSAVNFDGVNDYISAPTSSSLAVQGNTISLECWIKPGETIDGSEDQFICIIDKGDEYAFLTTPNDGRIWFAVILSPGPINWEGITTTISSWTAGTWYHIVGTYDGSYLSIYVNGVLSNSRMLSGNLNSPTSFPFTIGAHSLGFDYNFNGAIDEVKVFDYARTSDQILQDYQDIGLCDLEITLDSVSPTNPLEGQPTSITTTIINVGTKDVTSDILVILNQSVWYTNPINTPDYYQLGGNQIIWPERLTVAGGLSVGQSHTINWNWNATEVLNIDNLALYAVVDPLNEIPELDENDNQVTVIGNTINTIQDTIGFDAHVDGYSFKNWGLSENELLDLKNDIAIQLRLYLPYGNPVISAITNALYQHYADNGHCYGMATVSTLYYTGELIKPVTKPTFEMTKEEAAPDIIAFHLTQFPFNLQDISTPMDLTNEYNKIINNLNADPPRPCIMRIREVGKQGAHAVSVINAYDVSDTIKNIVIYDNNYPGMGLIVTFDLEQNKVIWDNIGTRSNYDNVFVYTPQLVYPSDIVRKIVHDYLLFMIHQGQRILSFKCPIEVDITDEYGRLISSRNGGINEIPNAIVEVSEITGSKTFYLPLSLTYNINIEAFDEGNVEASMMVPWETGATFSAVDFGVFETTIGYTDLYPDTLELVIHLDENGDGTIDSSVTGETDSIEEDTEAPDIAILNPSPYGIYPIDSIETFQFVITDNLDPNPSFTATVSDIEGNQFDVSSGDLLPIKTGVYTLQITATDFYDNTASEELTFVLYDPNGGFATGGGWFITDEESTMPDGRVNFGFVAKYKKSVSTGNLEFQYQDADINLKSTSIDWLTISNNKAIFQGTGTINNEGLYTFRVMATDNAEPGVDEDHFDIKIWEGTDTEADPIHKARNTISGGNIKVHKK